MDFDSKDIISNLPEALICHILSFLPVRDSAQTSVLSKKWRYLFAIRPNLDFEIENSRTMSFKEKARMLLMFTNFVDRVLSLQGNSTINKFSLNCGYGLNQDYVQLTRWISNVLELGVSFLDLRVMVIDIHLPSNIFMSRSLVSLRIDGRHLCRIDVEDVYLPKLKTIYLDRVIFGKTAACFDKLTSGCHALEELFLNRHNSYFKNLYVSSKTLKRLNLSGLQYSLVNPESISFDTPNLVYLRYIDYVAHKYPKVTFGSLVEADISLVLTISDKNRSSSNNLVRASNFFMGLCDVQILTLYANTLEVLSLCCRAMPVFNGLVHLTIHTLSQIGWESLPRLLENCPNLEILVFDGLNHKYTDRCEDIDGCLCRYGEEVRPCLSSSPVKILKIRLSEESNIEQIKYFLETMPSLEHLIVCYCPSDDDLFVKISNQIKDLPRIASPNCEIQVVEVM